MTFEPIISVIVPVYNGAEYVGEAIESIFAQSYTRFEIIVVNDGSTDNGATDEALKPYLDRVTYIKQENGGVASALNTGIENMTGDYFAWLSHDDLFLPHKLQSQVQLLSDLTDRKVVLYSDYAIMNFEKEHQYDVILDAYMLNTESNHMPVLRGCLNGCTMLVHREIFEVCGLFDVNLRHTQDYEMWDRMCWQYPMIHQADITVHQRVHDAQDSKRSDAVPECNSLWINMISSRNDATRMEISGGSLEFLKGMQKFLSHTPYIGAQDFVSGEISKFKLDGTLIDKTSLSPTDISEPTPNNVLSRPPSISESIELSGLSIILNNQSSYEEALRSINSLAVLESRKFEIIFMMDEDEQSRRLAKTLKKSSKYVRCVQTSGDLSEIREEALSIAQYDYVMFLTTQDVVMGHNLSSQLRDMKQTGYGVSYAPYISICKELSEQGVIVPSHWLENLTLEDIIGRCAVNISTMIFEKQVFSTGLKPPSSNLKSEIEFLLSVRSKFDIYAFTNISIVTYSALDVAPLNLTQMLDELSELLNYLESDKKFSKSAIDLLKERQAKLYTIRTKNESLGDDLSRNFPLEAAYKGDIDTNYLIGNTGLLDVDLMMKID